MREIKFRAWDKINKRMIWDSIEEASMLLGFTGTSRCICDVKCKEKDSFIGYPCNCPIMIYMQYTGLHDKNGKEIYEGDILGGLFLDCYVGWCDKCKSFELYYGADDDWQCSACNGDLLWYETSECDGSLEIIGNIYENPELLEDKDE